MERGRFVWVQGTVYQVGAHCCHLANTLNIIVCTALVMQPVFPITVAT